MVSRINYYSLTSLRSELLRELRLSKKPPTIILAESDPLYFLAGFLAAVTANCPIFLCNPHWVATEWQQVFNLVQPDLIWGKVPKFKPTSPPPAPLPPIESSPIMIPTGGSSGNVRFAIHTWETLQASVKGFTEYFGSIPVNSACILPLYHVSGLMQFLRSWLSEGEFWLLPYNQVKQGLRPNFGSPKPPQEFFISLVPTQLQYLLNCDPHWLSQFATVLLGGASPWQLLLDCARNYHIALAPCYGMTETASQVVTLKPNYFLKGNNTTGKVLPHAKVTIRSETGDLLTHNQIGMVNIQGLSLCRGYYPQLWQKGQIFATDDLGFFDTQGNLTIVGRRSQKIITGGENVFPKEVEGAILATGLVEDVCVLGIPDNYWGQVVIAVYVPKTPTISLAIIKQSLENKLSKYKYPKYWLEVPSLPRNAQGKINYKEVLSYFKNKKI